MTVEERIARVFRLDDEGWARHANPWSVWTRVAILPVLVLAFWSRAWIGWWFLVPVLAVSAFAYLNPRLFPKPRSTDNWASRGVLGERVWLNRRHVQVPPRHRMAPHVLAGIGMTGLPFLVWGLASLEIWPTLLGTALVYLGKMWFVDRMVWLYQDMADATPEYRAWLY